ncbi:DUF2167 domain-containing protein [Mesorhizobium sp. LHD-90]|uniref:DUF2167 domain-containing protein n=1 Tax=Mesorhizobium sp. LHD-90 TaxID=3071414 RepID=UPI0027DFB9AC|nr:DUF2167 domain-containing protein [Mesorhizobium sp. LHD-90]MDQ6435147.1 DUF2167 domain-containing protein [Mesorhizobium sp. LHD-90]
MKRYLFAIAISSIFSVSPLHAEKSAEFFPEYPLYNDAGKTFLDKIEPRIGKIDLPDGVSLDLRDKFYFLGKEDTIAVLTEAWGNPPTSAVGSVGMIFPVKYDPLASDGWGVLLSVDKIGYVDDKDAASIDYDDLLNTMRRDTITENETRKQDGFEPITLIGWAAPPVYDTENKRLHWAKELQFGNAEKHTLNYDVRFLGREGVLIMGYVASIDQLPEIQASLPDVLSTPSFAPGKRYSDFVPGVDTVAAVGVGGLIAGKVAAKAGLFAIALVALKKFGFLLIVPVAWLWRVIRRKSSTS